MPFSDEANKPYTYELLRKIDPDYVLDVGAGAGVYGRWIKANLNADVINAIEVWEPYIEQFGLNDVYHNVFLQDVRTGEALNQHYDVVIFGDVLEHMTKEEAAEVWQRACWHSDYCIISIPTVHYPQGAEFGNPYEAHVHDHWSVEEVLETFEGITQHETFGVTSVFVAANGVESVL